MPVLYRVSSSPEQVVPQLSTSPTSPAHLYTDLADERRVSPAVHVHDQSKDFRYLQSIVVCVCSLSRDRGDAYGQVGYRVL